MGAGEPGRARPPSRQLTGLEGVGGRPRAMTVDEVLRRHAPRPVIARESDTMDSVRRWLEIATWGAPSLEQRPASAATTAPTELTPKEQTQQDERYQARIKAFLEQLSAGDLRQRRSYEHEAGDLVGQRMEQAREYLREWRAKDPRGWRKVIQTYIKANLAELDKPRDKRRDLPLNPGISEKGGADPRTMPPRTGRGGRPKDPVTQQIYDAVRHTIDDRARNGRDTKGRQIAAALQSAGVPLPKSLRHFGTNWTQVYDGEPDRVRKFLHRARHAGRN
jgi:hypothetical protein